MAEIKWIKLNVDMFDNRKIKYLRKLPDGNNIVLIWVQLLTMAGRCNSGGKIFLTETIPYTTKMLADELNFEENTVILALNALNQLGMINEDCGTIMISGWEKHQNIDGMEKIRQQTRERVQRYREKQKLLQCNVTETLRNNDVTQQNKNKNKNKNINSISKDILVEQACPTPAPNYKEIADNFNLICVSLPKIKSVSDARKTKIKARLQSFSLDDLMTAFKKTQASDFLSGRSGDWKANFDWIINSDSNLTKILEGNYDNIKERARHERVRTNADIASEYEQAGRTIEEYELADDYRPFADI